MAVLHMARETNRAMKSLLNSNTECQSQQMPFSFPECSFSVQLYRANDRCSLVETGTWKARL